MNKENKETIGVQFCPACKRAVEISSRYPGYVCNACVLSATDQQGRAIEFYNTDIFGHGCRGQYREGGGNYNSNICYIKGIKCEANEAYMGGIVITPVGFLNL
jgi:hypothetical protein